MEVEEKSIVVREPSLALIRPIASSKDILASHDETARLIQDCLKEGVDYGVIPGTGGKPTLFKPGAERLCVAFGATPEYILTSSEVDHGREVKWDKKFKSGTSHGLYRFVYKCRLVRPDGRVLGEGEGVCSTMESKYVDRPRECENTVLKMAQKRALVGAALNAFGLSNRFTQDLDEQVPPDPREEVAALLARHKVPRDAWAALGKAFLAAIPGTKEHTAAKEALAKDHQEVLNQ